MCLTDYSIVDDYLNIDVTMPSLEVATIGGGTDLNDQNSCIKILGIDKNNHCKNPAENSKLLASIIASTVLCGELSLMLALSKGTLVKSHMNLNRGKL